MCGLCVYIWTSFVAPDTETAFGAQIGAGVYTETSHESTQTMFVRPDAVYVYTPIQRVVHQINDGVCTETPSESTHTMLVHSDVV